MGYRNEERGGGGGGTVMQCIVVIRSYLTDVLVIPRGIPRETDALELVKNYPSLWYTLPFNCVIFQFLQQG